MNVARWVSSPNSSEWCNVVNRTLATRTLKRLAKADGHREAVSRASVPHE